MAREHRNHILSHAIDTQHGRVFMLVFNERSNGAHANSHRPNKDKDIKICPILAHLGTTNGFRA